MSIQVEESKLPPRMASPILNNRGRFRISRDLVWSDAHNLKPLFDRVVVIEASVRWENDCIEYLALSTLFDVVPEGVAAPWYEINFTKENGEAVLGPVIRSKFQ